MKTIESAGIITFYIKNNVLHFLLLHYPHGHWDLPKGKIEKGETKKDAALRELKEETGLSAQLIDGFEECLEYFFKQDGSLIKKTVCFFVGVASSDGITLSHEHIGFEWLPYDQAIERLTFDSAQKVLEQANAFLRVREK